ncbi:metallophosphoesterase [Paenibacillus hamazuiensis]|uniref:metallophosphoesterase n=1 Tax=Paenibacillus hamazuiensis TaxID=2936508 RepID=UPI00200E572D|nr:metallophosphoesterase [Paenibacillus hamazuiensis]
MEQQPNITRRTFMKKGVTLLAAAFAAPPASFGYARYIEPGWLAVKELTLSFERLPSPFDGLRVVQFSDVHMGYHYSAGDLSRLADRIAELKPDLIAFTGDLYDSVVDADPSACIDALSKLKAPLGVYAVLGNHDYYDDAGKAAKVLAEGGLRVLRNEGVLQKRGSSAIRIAGVEDMWEGKPDLAKALKQGGSETFTLLLSHAPDFADEALASPVDLQLSGHSHGGQVRLPLYGHIFTPPYSRKYVDGLYRLGDSKLQLYVNRGIGVSVYPVRFCCRPELTVLTLRRQ